MPKGIEPASFRRQPGKRKPTDKRIAGHPPEGDLVGDPLDEAVRNFKELFIVDDLISTDARVQVQHRRLVADRDGKVSAAKRSLRKLSIDEDKINYAILKALAFSTEAARAAIEKQVRDAQERIREIDTVLRHIPKDCRQKLRADPVASKELKDWAARSAPDAYSEARRHLLAIRDSWKFAERTARSGPLGISIPQRIKRPEYVALRILRDTLFTHGRAPHEPLAWIIETAFDLSLDEAGITAALRRPRKVALMTKIG